MMLNLNALPSAVADALLLQARREGRSIHEMAINLLTRGLQAQDAAIDPIDLADPDSSWIESPAFEQALVEFAQLDAQAV